MSFNKKPSGASTVGVDIGTNQIKVVEVKSGKDGLQVAGYGIAPTPAGSIDNEVIVDPKTLSQALRQVLSDSGISCKRCVSLISGQSSVIVRIIEVPKMTREELAETMQWEIERHVPFSKDEVVMDFAPIEREESAEEEQNMEVLLAVAQQDAVNSHIETLFLAGLDPVALDIEYLSACRMLIDASPNSELKEESVALVNIGASTTQMGVFRSGLLAFPRILPIAGDTITRAISEQLGISIEDAELLKCEQGQVMIDRIAPRGQAVNLDDGGEPDSFGMGMDFNLEDTQQDLGVGGNLGFIPNLGGYGLPEEPESEDSSAEADGAEDIVPVPVKPLVDFDLPAFDTGSEANLPEEAEPSIDPLGAPQDADSIFDQGDFASVFDSHPDIAKEDDELAPIDSTSLGLDVTSHYTKEQVFDAMATVLEELISEIHRSLEYYSSSSQDHPQRVILFGGTAKMPGIDKYLESELGIKVELADPLQELNISTKVAEQDTLQDDILSMPSCIGLAIRDMIGD